MRARQDNQCGHAFNSEPTHRVVVKGIEPSACNVEAMAEKVRHLHQIGLNVLHAEF